MTRKRTRPAPGRAANRTISRSELAAIADQLRQHAHNLDIQFRRIADIQADVDELKRRARKKNRKA